MRNEKRENRDRERCERWRGERERELTERKRECMYAHARGREKETKNEAEIKR